MKHDLINGLTSHVLWWSYTLITCCVSNSWQINPSYDSFLTSFFSFFSLVPILRNKSQVIQVVCVLGMKCVFLQVISATCSMISGQEFCLLMCTLLKIIGRRGRKGRKKERTIPWFVASVQLWGCHDSTPFSTSSYSRGSQSFSSVSTTFDSLLANGFSVFWWLRVKLITF